MRPGDRVWYFFRHDHGIAEVTAAGHRIEVFTGLSEMRCRPATVAGVLQGHPVETVHTGPLTVVVPADQPLHLNVDFDPSDRIAVPGGVVVAPERLQGFVDAHDGDGKLGRGWPEHHSWADRPHSSAKATAAA